jgi:hypothetical protein
MMLGLLPQADPSTFRFPCSVPTLADTSGSEGSWARLVGVVAQSFVEQGVDPPLGCVRFPREVFIVHFHRYPFVQAPLIEIGDQVIQAVPEAADLLAGSEERYPFSEVA